MRALILAIAVIGCTRVAPGAVDAGRPDAGAVTIAAAPPPHAAGGNLSLGFADPATAHGLTLQPSRGEPDGDLVLERNGRDMLRWVGAKGGAPVLRFDGASGGAPVVRVSPEEMRLAVSTWLQLAVPTCPPLRFRAADGRDLLVLEGACDDAGRLLRFLFLEAGMGRFKDVGDPAPGLVRE